MPSNKTVRVGTRFRSAYADSNSLWEVKKSRGKGTWDCEIVDDEYTIDGKTYRGDYAGTRRVFGSEEILQAAAMEKLWKNLGNENDRFYAELVPGHVVHYDNGFGCFVRCEVVVQDGKHVLRPFELVGPWPQYDLWRRDRTGQVDYGYYPMKILDRETMTPNCSSIYEHSSKKGSPNPQTLSVVSFEAPAMTPEESKMAYGWQTVSQVQNILNNAKDPWEALSKVARMTEEWRK